MVVLVEVAVVVVIAASYFEVAVLNSGSGGGRGTVFLPSYFAIAATPVMKRKTS